MLKETSYKKLSNKENTNKLTNYFFFLGSDIVFPCHSFNFVQNFIKKDDSFTLIALPRKVARNAIIPFDE